MKHLTPISIILGSIIISLSYYFKPQNKYEYMVGHSDKQQGVLNKQTGIIYTLYGSYNFIEIAQKYDKKKLEEKKLEKKK